MKLLSHRRFFIVAGMATTRTVGVGLSVYTVIDSDTRMDYHLNPYAASYIAAKLVLLRSFNRQYDGDSGFGRGKRYLVDYSWDRCP